MSVNYITLIMNIGDNLYNIETPGYPAKAPSTNNPMGEPEENPSVEIVQVQLVDTYDHSKMIDFNIDDYAIRRYGKTKPELFEDIIAEKALDEFYK